MTHPYIIQPNEVLTYLNDIRDGKVIDKGRFNVPEIDDFLRFKQGNFVVVTGHANTGKTHTIMYLMLLHTLNHGTKWLIYSSENHASSLYRKLIQFKEAMPLMHITDRRFAQAFDFVHAHFKFIDGEKLLDAFQLIEVAEQVMQEWEFEGLMIDPYNSLMINQKRLGKISTHEYHYEVTSFIRVFCKKYNALVIVNTHPNTEALRRLHAGKHPYSGHPMPPMAADVEGGGKFVNRADEFVVIHRYVQHESDWRFTDIHVRKCKELETGGRPTPLDNPIRLESMKMNCGYFIGLTALIKPHIQPTHDDNPF
jgi:archaellum biogenesis ATPase FlaH